MLSAPLTIGCSSGQYIASSDLTLPTVAGMSFSTPINLKDFTDSCAAGKTLFNATINSRGQTANSLLSDFFAKFLDDMTSSMLNYNISSMVEVPSISSELDKIGNVNFTLDTSQYQYGTIAPGVNIPGLAKNLTDAANAVTLTSVNSDLASQTTLTANIDALNQKVKTDYPSATFTDFTQASVTENYIKPNVSLDVSNYF